MRRIAAKGKTFNQGASGGLARANEGPVMANAFTYDFWMDTVEVTQGAYEELMHFVPVPPSSPYGHGADMPVHGVSWYDAVLYCNARSRKFGLDTVYEYVSTIRNQAGGAFEMSGLRVRLDRGGFRLPTEAEWEFSAKAGAETPYPWGGPEDTARAGEYAWHAGNSGDRVRPVGTRKANAFGLRDMAGNVMEWVNDWKGAYLSGGLVDFAGARDPGPDFEKPVKGGAFKYGHSELRPANRSATYTTIPSAATEYVGFRCVLGAIPKPAFTGLDALPLATDPFTLEVTRLHGKLGGRGAKLVFVNASPSSRHLVLVDYRTSPPKAREFADHAKVFHPSISPDGAWVAFGTALEGAEGVSEIFIRPLDGSGDSARKVGEGFIPRWWVDEAAKDTFLVYTTSAVDNRADRWASTSTMKRRMAGGKPQGESALITADGGFHDGISADGRYLVTGYRLLKVRDQRDEETRVLFTAPRNGKSEGDTSQVCNVSIAPDSSGQTLFLDFGYPEKSAVTGGPYGIHQVAFLADPAGNILQWWKAPRGEEAWADLEWSNHRGYAVAGATDPAGDQRSLYLVGLGDSAHTRLVTGTALLQPALWVSGQEAPPVQGLDLDSLGRYNEPATIEAQTSLAIKMHDFWKRHAATEAFFLGSSQMIDGVDPSQLTSLKGLNLAFGSGDMAAAYHILRNYILPHAGRVKLVAFSVPLGWFNVPGADLTWHRMSKDNLGFTYDRNHGHWKGGLPTGFVEAITAVPYPHRGPIDSLGFGVLPSRNWGPTHPPEVPGIDWDTSIPEYRANLEEFARTVDDLARRGIRSVFLTFPQSPAYNAMKSWSMMGPSRSTAKAIIADLQALAARQPMFKFYDFNRDGLHGYVDAEAYDENHLSAEGALRLSRELDAELRKFLP